MTINPPSQPWPIEMIPTADGARVAVKRRPNPGGTPLVFLHGLASNADFWDMPSVRGPDFEFRSLADVLYELGYDIWLVNFRGHGAPQMYSDPPAAQDDWCVDHFAAFDLPAVIDRVAAGGQRPFIVGSSMGSMALAAWLMGAAIDPSADPQGVRLDDAEMQRRACQIAGAVFVEFPAALRWPVAPVGEDDRLDWSELVRGLRQANHSMNLPFELLARSVALHNLIERSGQVRLGWLRLNPRRAALTSVLPNTLAEGLLSFHRTVTQKGLDWVGKITGHSHHRAEIVLTARRTALDDIKAGVLAQMARSVRARGFVSGLGDPGLVYSDFYARINVPLLLVSGGRDRVANAEIGREVFFNTVAAVDKFELFLPDFGHGEYSATPAGCERVYPRIVSWLKERDSLSRSA